MPITSLWPDVLEKSIQSLVTWKKLSIDEMEKKIIKKINAVRKIYYNFWWTSYTNKNYFDVQILDLKTEEKYSPYGQAKQH
jgi:hypothetical protein